MRRGIRLFAAVLIVVMVTAFPAAGHERRSVSGFDLSVGWTVEPAYAGFLNGVGVTITQNAQPVTDIPADALKVEVSTGSDRTTVSLAPAFRVGVFGTPGQYTAPLIPTRAGTYTWHVTGTIHETKIDASFTSGETTFDSPADPSAVQFPDKAPSGKQLADRIDQEVPRLTQANTRLASALNKAEDKASTATLLGYVGIGAGAIALMLSIAGFNRRKPAM